MTVNEPISGDLQEFAMQVQQRADLPTLEEAEQLVRVTLRTLGEQLSRGQAEKLGAGLPHDLESELLSQQSSEPEGFDADAFLDQVAVAVLSVNERTVTEHVRAVLITLRQWADTDEIDDTVEQLPTALAELFS